MEHKVDSPLTDTFAGRKVFFGSHLAAAQFACVIYVGADEYIVTASLTPLLFTSPNFLACFAYDCTLHNVQHENMTDEECQRTVTAAVDALLEYIDLGSFPIASQIKSFGVEINRELLKEMQTSGRPVKDILPFSLYLRPTKEAFKDAVKMVQDQMAAITAAINAGAYPPDALQVTPGSAFPLH